MDLDIHTELERVFGFKQFRSGQKQVIQALLEGDSSLAIFPTGSGKSLCYQFTALQLPHLTVVVSPLLALMKDQLEFLRGKRIPAASLDSTLTADESRRVMTDVRSGQTKILMVSVERFKNERFRQFISSVQVSMLVVDEAHCISEWGHNFRPDYLKLPSYAETLSNPQILLLTATATEQVKMDMAARFKIAPERIVQTGFYRSNLDLTVLPAQEADKPAQLLNLLRQQQGAGIVYVTLQQTAQQMAEALCDHGIDAAPYHAGLAAEQRQQVQERFMQDNLQVVVATIAFGMGVDKSNIRFVIHYDLPKSIENYSQEIGRSGRDGLPSNCITLANLDGLNIIENFIYGDTPERKGIEQVIASIGNERQGNKWEMQLNALSSESNVRQLPLKTLLVQLELAGVIRPRYTYFADFRYKFVLPQQQILARFEGERRAFLQAVFTHTEMKKIWGSLNFDDLFADYRCERGRVVAAMDYLQEQGWIELETKRITEVFEVNVQALASPDLAKSLFDYFLAKEAKEIRRIAELVAFFEQTSCLSVSLARYFGDNKIPERCCHCSVCRGHIAQLTYSTTPPMPSDQQLQADMSELERHLNEKGAHQMTPGIASRFLAGLQTPVFSRHKVKALGGFGRCSAQRYQAILEKVTELRKLDPEDFLDK